MTEARTLADYGIKININDPPKGNILIAESLNHKEAITMAITTAKELLNKGCRDFVQIVPRDAERYSVYQIPEVVD